MGSSLSAKWVGSFLSAWWIAAAALTALSATVTPDHQAYLPGEPIKVYFEGGPGGRTDWIGVYPENIIPDGNPAATLWNYVDNTRAGSRGFREGFVTLPGLPTAGTWNVFFLINDGYSYIAANQLTVLDGLSPLVRAASTTFAPGQSITISFNGSANPKDWVGIYKLGQTPGAPETPSTLFLYVDGTQTGTSWRGEGAVTFAAGLSQLGEYVAYLLENDGYTILASDRFRVENLVPDKPRVLSLEPANNKPSAEPTEGFSAVIEHGKAAVSLASVLLRLDDTFVIHRMTTISNRVTVSYTPTNLFAPESFHQYSLVFGDVNGDRQTNIVKFFVSPYIPLTLPDPIVLETFDSGSEGELPAGWTQENYTEVLDDTEDLGNLNSASYKTWTKVNASRFEAPLIPYSQPDNPTLDYRRVLTAPRAAVVNGQVLTNLATGKLLFANSGYRRGTGQAMFVTTPDYNLVGRTNVHLVFHALMEQNQDSIATVEYSVDGGVNWLPIAYYLDAADIKRTETSAIDVAATLSAEQTDTAKYTDDGGVERGGTYGSYLSAPSSALRAEHFQIRRDNDAADGKRVEDFRLAAADNQQRVRFRLGYAGTDSWYFGIDNFGLYSLAHAIIPPAPVLAVERIGAQLRLSWVGVAKLQLATSLTSQDWVSLPLASPVTLGTESAVRFFRLIP